MSINYTVLIQARTSSTRLPNKVLLKISGKTLLEHVVRRAQAAKSVYRVIVATTIDSADLRIVKWCADNYVSVFCGSREDVLDRYYQTAKLFEAVNVIRITSDCPLIDPQLIDAMIEFHKQKKTDYAANILEESFPDGEDIEIITFATLEKAWKTAKLPSEREHVTPYIRNHPKLFSLANYRSQKNWSKLRWTVDEPKDLLFVKAIYKHLYKQKKLFGMNDIIELLKRKPKLLNINSSIARNQGYLKSLRED